MSTGLRPAPHLAVSTVLHRAPHPPPSTKNTLPAASAPPKCSTAAAPWPSARQTPFCSRHNSALARALALPCTPHPKHRLGILLYTSQTTLSLSLVPYCKPHTLPALPHLVVLQKAAQRALCGRERAVQHVYVCLLLGLPGGLRRPHADV